MADWTSEQIQTVIQAIGNLGTTSTGIDGKLETLLNGDAANSVPGLTEQIHTDNQALIDAINGLQLNGVDYSESMRQMATLVAYTDMLLIVLIVLVVLIGGLVAGGMVTRWMKSRK